jgi:hypothetical protein
MFLFISSHNVEQIKRRLEEVTLHSNSFGRVVDKQEKLIHVGIIIFFLYLKFDFIFA